jgi:ferredoxin
MPTLHDHLCRYDSRAWATAVETLSDHIHEVDRNATKIWFAFYPLDLFLVLESADDEAAAIRMFGLMGEWRLADHIDTSHRFLYAHRYWPQVKSAIHASVEPFSDDLAELVRTVAAAASRTTRCDAEFLNGITAAGLMTLRQAGDAAFRQTPGRVHLAEKIRARSAHQVMSRRAKDDWQGVFGFTRGLKKLWTVTFDENDPDATFSLINGQEVTTAAQADKREYKSADGRCTPNEGPIPVECRAGSCGTCWVGVLGGAEKLSPVVDRDERRRMQVFGYVDSAAERPLIRLACQAVATGAVSIVIPPWNGMFGQLRQVRTKPGDGGDSG